MKDEKHRKKIPEQPTKTPAEPGQEPSSVNHEPANSAQVNPAPTGSNNGSHPADQGSVSAEGAQSTPEQAQAPMIALSMEEYDILQKELEKSRADAAINLDGWQRERADFLNYKKRIDRDAALAHQNILTSVIKKYLVVVDDLERALKTRPTAGEGVPWSDGIELILRKLNNLLESEGITRMQVGNDTFDPTRHEAVTYEESPDHQSGQIIEVVQPGYLLGDRVIRPAQVRVAK